MGKSEDHEAVTRRRSYMKEIMSQFTAQSFEIFVSSVLRQIAASEKKEIALDAILPQDISPETPGSVSFDAIAPLGFGQIDGLVIFEYKFNLLSTKAASVQKAVLNRMKNEKMYTEATVVIVTNTICDRRLFYNNDTVTSAQRIRFELWDKGVVDGWIEKYPIDYSNAINKYKLPDKAYIPDITQQNFLEKSNNNIKILKEIITYNDCFALVLGAGVSIDPGAKSWKDILKYFEKELEIKGVIDNSEVLCEKIGNSSIITAQLCKELYKTDNDYFWAIHSGLYDSRKSIDNSFSIYQLARIIKQCETKKHFRVLTYNFDEYLEKYLEDQGVSYNTLYDSDCSVNDKLCIYHVHGFMPNVKAKSYLNPKYLRSIYLTEENYNELYNQPYSWQISSQLSFFRENVCLFVGCSLADPNIRRLLEMTKKENKTHFAVLTKGSMTATDLTVAANHFSRIGIEVIWVNDFPDIAKTLQLL